MSNITDLGFVADDIVNNSGRAIFKRIANYYWEHQTPSIDGSIWVWLEKEYGAKRHYPELGPEGKYHYELVHGLQLEFEDPALQTAFLLRWT